MTCGCHSFYYRRGSQPFRHSLGHKPNAAPLAGRWDRGVLRDRGSQLPVRRLLGGFGSSGRWQVSLMGADMKSLDEGVTTLTVRLLPKASWISWDLGKHNALWLSLAEFTRNVCVSDLLRPKQASQCMCFACQRRCQKQQRFLRNEWNTVKLKAAAIDCWFLVDSRLHEGFPFISSILQAAVWHRKDRMREMHFERYLKYLEIFILHDVYPVNCWVCCSFSQEMFGIIDWAAESREAMPQATAAWSLKRPCVPRCRASRAFAQVEVTPLETNGKQLDVAHTVEDECTDCCSCYLHQGFIRQKSQEHSFKTVFDPSFQDSFETEGLAEGCFSVKVACDGFENEELVAFKPGACWSSTLKIIRNTPDSNMFSMNRHRLC